MSNFPFQAEQILMMWDAVNLFVVNKIPLYENDIKT